MKFFTRFDLPRTLTRRRAFQEGWVSGNVI